jgi:DNA-binding transcriptional MocR family regulator
MKVLEVPSSPILGIKPNALQEALQNGPIAALVLVPSFSNPTGSLMTVENRNKILALSELYDIPLIEDDLFSELNYHGKSLPAIKSMESSANVIYCSSVSKSLGSGLVMWWKVSS